MTNSGKTWYLEKQIFKQQNRQKFKNILGYIYKHEQLSNYIP